MVLKIWRIEIFTVLLLHPRAISIIRNKLLMQFAAMLCSKRIRYEDVVPRYLYLRY